MKNQIIEQVKNAIRNPFAWPGGYPVYAIMDDGQMLCPQCARKNFRQIVSATKDNLRNGWRAIGADVLWEGQKNCGNCGKVLESAYGETEE